MKKRSIRPLSMSKNKLGLSTSDQFDPVELFQQLEQIIQNGYLAVAVGEAMKGTGQSLSWLVS